MAGICQAGTRLPTGRGRRSSGREGAKPSVPATQCVCLASLAPVRPGSPREGVALFPLALRVLWRGRGPPGVIGQCVFCPLDVAVPCKIRSSPWPNKPGGGVWGGLLCSFRRRPPPSPLLRAGVAWAESWTKSLT